MQHYEESQSFLGTWGPFQKRVFYLLGLAIIPSGYNLLCVIFLLATPPHHCFIPHHSNLSHDWIQASIPVQVRTLLAPHLLGSTAYSSKDISFLLVPITLPTHHHLTDPTHSSLVYLSPCWYLYSRKSSKSTLKCTPYVLCHFALLCFSLFKAVLIF